MAKPIAVKTGTREEGSRAFKIGAVFWAVALAFIVAGVVWLGPEQALDINSRDFFPLPAGFAFLSAAFGTFYLGQGVLFLRRFDKYGASTLEAGDAVLGKTFKGKIRTSGDLAARGPFALRLLCARETKGGSGDYDNAGSSSIVTTRLWEAVATAPASTRSSAGIPFEFAIPSDGLQTLVRPFSEGHNIKWTLHVTAPLAGLNYSATFPVDVGGAQSASVSHDQAPFAGALRPEQTWQRIARYVAPVLGILFFVAGSYATLNQMFYGGIPFAGRIVSVNMPSVDVELENGGVVRIARVTRNTAWQAGQAVRVSCVEDETGLRSCRMNSGGDRWIDAIGTFVVGGVLLLLGMWLWRRHFRRQPR